MNNLNWNIKKNRGSGFNYYFARFDSWQELMSKGNEWNEELKSNPNFKKFYDDRNFKSMQSEWITEETPTLEELDKGFYTRFIEQDLLDNVTLAFDEILADIDMGGSFKKSKLIITDRPQGIFDFGLASLGLFTEQEFYSEKLAEESPLEFPKEPKGIVPNIFVNQNQLGDFWYVSNFSGNKYKMTQQDKGTQKAMLEGYAKNEIPNRFKSFKTNQKKSYLLFKKEGGSAKKVDLYVPVGGLGNMDSSGMLQRALPLFMAAKFFESVGIRTRLNATRLYSSGGTNLSNGKNESGFTCITSTIKDFGEDLDFTKLAVAVADVRTFRYNLWKLSPAITGKLTGAAQYGYGSTLYEGGNFKNTARRFKNWYYDEIENNNKEWVEIPKPLMIFGGVPNPDDSWNYNGNKNESGYQKIVKEFYRILDTVDFYYNDGQKASERIYERYVETGEKDVTEYKDYVQGVLENAYSVADGEPYADPKEDKDKLMEEFEEKVEKVSTFLSEIKRIAK